MNQSGKVHFNRKQVDYLLDKTGCDDPHDAVEIFARIIRELHIDPFKMHAYLEKLMEKDGV